MYCRFCRVEAQETRITEQIVAVVHRGQGKESGKEAGVHVSSSLGWAERAP